MRPIACSASSTAETFPCASASDNSVAVAKLHGDVVTSSLPVQLVWTAICVTGMTAARPGLLLGRTYQNADAEYDGTAEHDLEHGLKERRVHIARANIGDRPQFEEHHDAGDRG